MRERNCPGVRLPHTHCQLVCPSVQACSRHRTRGAYAPSRSIVTCMYRFSGVRCMWYDPHCVIGCTVMKSLTHLLLRRAGIFDITTSSSIVSLVFPRKHCVVGINFLDWNAWRFPTPHEGPSTPLVRPACTLPVPLSADCTPTVEQAPPSPPPPTLAQSPA